MAKQRGIVFLEGTIGGVNFYYRTGVPTARIAGGGFTREAIKKSANMVRVRESNDEFADCSTTNKVFKHAIRPFTLGYKDGTLHGRLMQLFLKIVMPFLRVASAVFLLAWHLIRDNNF